MKWLNRLTNLTSAVEPSNYSARKGITFPATVSLFCPIWFTKDFIKVRWSNME